MSRYYDYSKDLKKDLDILKIVFRVLDSWIVTVAMRINIWSSVFVMQRLEELGKICCNFIYDLSMLLISVHFDLFLFSCFFLGFRVIEFM